MFWILEIAAIAAVGILSAFLVGKRLNERLLGVQERYSESGRTGAYKLVRYVVRPVVIALVCVGVGAVALYFFSETDLVSALAFAFYYVLASRTLAGDRKLDAGRVTENAVLAAATLAVIFVYYHLPGIGPSR